MRFLIPLFLSALPAAADNWALRDTDRPLSSAELSQTVVGQTLTFYDGGQSRFSATGQYSYTYDGGGASLGRYEVMPEGIICVEFENGWARCDKFVRSETHIVLLTEKGDRFPIRP